jgi:hypothetical protein
MFSIHGTPHRLCDGLGRRDFLRIGTLGGLGLSLPALAQTVAAPRQSSRSSFGRARRCVLLFLTGGPPQHDTWDLKPSAPAEVRGELKPIATNVTGMRISELFPKLARQADKYCVVRSVTHHDTVHTSAGYTMLTGVYHPQANARSATDIRPGPNDHPHVGSLLAKVRPAREGLPAFASLPEVIRDAGVNEFPGQDAGFLGKQFAPFRIEADNARASFPPPDIALPPDVTVERLDNRRSLLQQLDHTLSAGEAKGTRTDLDACYQQAFGLMRSSAVRQAFALEHEPDRVRESYGKHLFGQGCLLARRLLEAGVALVTVYWHYEGPDDSPVWDTHQNNYPHLRNRLMPPTDEAVATLLDDLAQRGLLAETLLVCMGEFGRTPRINRHGGRDHWPAVQSLMLAGAGIHGGSVYGASDRLGAYPAELPVSPPDLVATLLHLLGVPPDLEVHDRTNRPLRACEGKPIPGLIA